MLLFVALLVLSWLGDEAMARLFGAAYFARFGGVLVLAILFSSAALLLNERRKNPEVERERGEWTARELVYAVILVATFFMAAWYVPALFFSF